MAKILTFPEIRDTKIQLKGAGAPPLKDGDTLTLVNTEYDTYNGNEYLKLEFLAGDDKHKTLGASSFIRYDKSFEFTGILTNKIFDLANNGTLTEKNLVETITGHNKGVATVKNVFEMDDPYRKDRKIKFYDFD